MLLPLLVGPPFVPLEFDVLMLELLLLQVILQPFLLTMLMKVQSLNTQGALLKVFCLFIQVLFVHV